jgi:hypothetical protein
MVTRNVKIVAQGQADATYASTQKKNPFRLYSAILNGGAYGGETLVRQNMQDTVPTTSSEAPPPEPVDYDLFSPSFNADDWQLNNSQNATSPIVGIQMMPVTSILTERRSSSFYKTPFDLTRPFSVIATFLTQTSPGDPPLDGFTVAFSASPLAYGAQGGNLGIAGAGNTFPVVAVALSPLNINNTFLARANITAVPNGSPVTLGGIGTKITTVNDLGVTVKITYTLTAGGTLSWSIIDDAGPPAPVTNVYTNVSFPTMLGVNNGYLGCSLGGGSKYQPVFLTGMSFTQYI